MALTDSFESFRNKLISFNWLNPLYNIKKNKSTYITDNISLLADLLTTGKTEILKNLNSENKAEKSLAQTLDKIVKIAKTSEAETGLTSSFMVYGLFEHDYNNIENQYKKNTPIILIPVKLEKLPTKLKISLDEDEIVENQTFLKYVNNTFVYPRDEIKEFNHADITLDILKKHLLTLAEEINQLNTNNKNIRINSNIICLANLTNEQNLLYQDINNNIDEYYNSVSLQNLFNQKTNNSSNESSYNSYIELPDESKIYNFHPILEADSSQMQAIFHIVNKQQNLIIQGPPGTGKSQTIANILVELMQQGKKVLFVSEKAVATQVVYDRIKAVNTDLANQCLMLHNTKIKSIHIVKAVNSALDIKEKTSFDTYFLHQLVDKKEILNHVHQDLHHIYFKEIWNKDFKDDGFNIYQLNSLIIKLENEGIISLNCQLDLDYLTNNNAYRNAYNDLEDSNTNNFFANNNFYSSEFKALLPESSLSINHLEKLNQYLNISASKITNLYKLQTKMADNFKDYLKYDAILLNNLDNFKDTIQALHTMIKNLKQLLVNLKDQSSNILNIKANNFSKNSLICKKITVAEVNHNFSLKSNILIKLLKYKPYKKLNKLLLEYTQSLHQANKIMQLEDFTTFTESNNAWKKAENLLQNELSIINNIIIKHEWNKVSKYVLPSLSLANLYAMQSNIDLFEEYSKEVNQIKNIYQLDTFSFDKCKNSINDIYQQLQTNYKLQNIFIKEELAEYQVFFNLNELYKNDCINMQANFSALANYKTFINKKHKLENDYQLKGFFQAYFAQTIPRDNLCKSFDLLIYTYMLNNIEQQKFLDITNINQDISKFKDYEEGYFKINPKRILKKIKGRAINLNDRDTQYFKNSQSKSRLKISCRDLVNKYNDYLHTLFPIWVMSPLSVVKFIKANTKFDVVIFDEASQIRVENSLATLTRANRFVIVGDTQQMPPSNLFAHNDDDDNNDYDKENLDNDDTESILSFATAKLMRTTILSWHYRSKYEQLIKPSNHECYEGKLITMPSVDATIFPIEHILVADGVWYGKKEKNFEAGNLKEVEKIMELLPQIIKQYPNKSIGIITFGRKQSNLIESQLQSNLSKIYNQYFDVNKEAKKGFIKNLENCQGDEADIVIISVSYGKNKDGKFNKSFGSINNKDGFKRLNVAFSRTREKLYLISSFKANALGDLGDLEGERKGVKFLQNYLKYAEEQTAKNISSWQTKYDIQTTESPFEEVVKQKLEELGYKIKTQVGHGNYRIDLAILDHDSKKYILGIECDGATYHSSKSARDRDRLRQKKLEQDGWAIHRIWSTNWKNDYKKELQSIQAIMQNLQNKQP